MPAATPQQAASRHADMLTLPIAAFIDAMIRRCRRFRYAAIFDSY